MSAFRTVFDFLSSVPEAMAHEEIYKEKVAKARTGIPEDLDLSELEYSTVGIGERNLLRDLRIADKFRYPGMDVVMKVNTGSFAKQKEKVFGKGSLSHERVYEESFLSNHLIDLEPIELVVSTSGRQGLQVSRDAPLYAQICGALSGISGRSLVSPGVVLLGERLVVKQDLRHFFLKGYLMLMSYNLSVAADVFDMEYEPISVDLRKGVTGLSKLGVLMSYPMVLDVEHFTNEELWLIGEMAGPYPNTRYGKDNIYSCIQLESDLLAMLSGDKDFDIGPNPGHGSPERMWNELVSIAIKFDAVDDLMEVVRDFRGVPGLLRAVGKATGEGVFTLAYPKSYSIKMGVESIGKRNAFVKRNSGYYATTKNLVADLMLSRMMEMSAFNILEELGAFGTLGCPTGKAMTDIFLNSNLRGYGLKRVGDMDNYLLQEWRGCRGSSMPVNFDGFLKGYVQRKCAAIKSGDVSDLRPQLLYSLPYSQCKNTTWGVIRGWRMQDYIFLSKLEERIAMNQLVKAFTWVMGVSLDLPKVGLNSKGNRFEDLLSLEENKFIQFAAGEYEIGMVRHGLGAELAPRMDEYEMGMTAFYSTSFPGTRCTIVFDMAGTPTMVNEKKIEDSHTMSTLGLNKKKIPDGEMFHTPGGSKQYWDPYKDEEEQAPITGEPPLNGHDLPRILEERRSQENSSERTSHEEDRPIDVEDRDEEMEEQQVETPNKPTYAEVAARKLGPLGYRFTPTLDMKDGAIVPKEVELNDGQKVALPIYPDRRVIEGDVIRGYRLKTPGDGTCGIHAIMQDKVLKGYIDPESRPDAYKEVLNWVGSQLYHNISELGGVCAYLKSGCVVIDATNRRIVEFGTQGAEDVVYLVLEGNHYETFIPNDRGNSEFRNFARMKSNYSPEEQLKALVTIQTALKSDYVANMIVPTAMKDIRKSLTGDGVDKFFDALPKSLRVDGMRYLGVPNHTDRVVQGKNAPIPRSDNQHQQRDSPRGGRGGRRGGRGSFVDGRGRGRNIDNRQVRFEPPPKEHVGGRRTAPPPSGRGTSHIFGKEIRVPGGHWKTVSEEPGFGPNKEQRESEEPPENRMGSNAWVRKK